jgi:hypothetical protein
MEDNRLHRNRKWRGRQVLQGMWSNCTLFVGVIIFCAARESKKRNFMESTMQGPA